MKGILVVHKTKFLGVLGGDIEEGEEFEESLAKDEIKCKKIASLALQLWVLSLGDRSKRKR